MQLNTDKMKSPCVKEKGLKKMRKDANPILQLPKCFDRLQKHINGDTEKLLKFVDSIPIFPIG